MTEQNSYETKRVGFLDNSFYVHQPKKGGHKSGLDAVLVAAAVPDGFSGRVADFGAGNGTAGMAVAQRCRDVTVDLIEINPKAISMIELALSEVNNAHLAPRLSPVTADVTDLNSLKASGLSKGSFDFIIANPPFNDGSHRSSPDEDRALAHDLPADGLDGWLESAANLLKPKGRTAFIVRPSNLSAVLATMERLFGDISILPVHPKQGQSASRILIAGTKGSKAALKLLSGLVLHDADGKFTDETENILRGRTGISL